MDISKRLYARLNEYFKDNIKLIYIRWKNVIIITKDNKFHQIDNCVNDNYREIAINYDENVVKELIKKSTFEELYDKEVVNIESGICHTIVRTSEGKVYVWGKNSYGVLGNGLNDREIYRPQVNKYLIDLNIIEISCGLCHTIVLTSSGDIYGWGWNRYGQCGNGSDCKYQLIPFKMNDLIDVKFKAISCGTYHSMAVTTDGRVFACGDNRFEQLGDGSDENVNRLKYIDINDVIIEKISCGLTHSILLSNNGEIYICGEYMEKKAKDNKYKIEKLNHLNKFIEIAMNTTRNIFAALSESGIYYVWGDISDKNNFEYETKETSFKSFNEIFIKYFDITYKPLEGMIVAFRDSYLYLNYNRHNQYKEIKLGEGSYGEVFKVMNKTSNDLIAIKRIKITKEDEKNIMKELEINNLIERIKHKNIVEYKEFWIEKNESEKLSTLCISMELCDQTLSQLIETFETLNFFNKTSKIILKYYIYCAIFTNILEGVNCLHKYNPPIIHRDLKPDNILVKFDENKKKYFIKIADFGLATVHKFVEQTHSDKGHIEYVAPEVLKGLNYDTKADIYSLGIILNDLFDGFLDNG
jgi:hypothetical protein